MFCMHCGQQLPPDAVFCPNCGQKAETASDTSAGTSEKQPKIDCGFTLAVIAVVVGNVIGIVALIYASTALPFTIYLLSGYFATLPKDYEEAAYVDGSGYFRTMVQIIMPMAKPSIITVILFNFLSFWNEYIISMTLLTDESVKTLPVGLMNLMKAQNAAAQYGQMYAGLVIVMLPTLILYIMVQKKLTQGMTVGGLKG